MSIVRSYQEIVKVRRLLWSVASILLVASLSATLSAFDGLTVTGLNDLTIVQRQAGVGAILVSGAAPAGVSAIEAQVVDEAGTTAVTPWTAIATASGGAWSGRLAGVPQGGWYRIAVRPTGQAVAPTVGTARWGVGAVVACLGQSNMVNMFYVSAGPAASDPRTRLRGYRGAGGNGPGPVVGNGAIRLANSLRARLGVPVLLLDYAQPGLPIAAWTVPTDANWAATWQGFTAGLRAAGGDCELVLWHQGANDALYGATEAGYRRSLDTLYANLNALVPDRRPLPFVCALQNRGDYQPKPATADDGYDRVRRAQWLWANATPGVVPGGATIDMTLVDIGHWTAPDYEVLADRLGQSALHALLPADYPATSGGAVLSGLMQSGRTVRVKVRHDAGTRLTGRSANTGLDGFVVDTGAGTPVLNVVASRISAADEVELTLAADPGAPVRVRYLVGMNPFPSKAVGNLLYDDTAYLNGRVGLPVNAESAGIAALVAQPPATVTVLRRVAIDVGGGRPTPAPWNNLVWPARSLAALRDDAGLATPFALTVTEPFLNNNGLGVDAASGAIPASALVDFQFGGANFQGQSATRAAIKLSGLDPTATYTLSMGASRTGVTDNRETRYTAVGAGAPVVRLLQIAENRGTLAVADGLRPAADGTLMLYVDKGPANTTINGFFYLGLLLIVEVRTVAAGPG